MTNEEFELWLRAFSEVQIEALRKVRALILKNTEGLTETVNEGKWLNRYVFYSRDSQMVFAIGPNGKSKTTLHMMPYYGSEVLQNRHSAALSPFLTGKSCIAFRDFSELPISDLMSILKAANRNLT